MAPTATFRFALILYHAKVAIATITTAAAITPPAIPATGTDEDEEALEPVEPVLVAGAAEAEGAILRLERLEEDKLRST